MSQWIVILFYFISFRFFLCSFWFCRRFVSSNQQKSSSIYIQYTSLPYRQEWNKATHTFDISEMLIVLFFSNISIYARYYFAVYIDINTQSILFYFLFSIRCCCSIRSNAFKCKAFEFWISALNPNLSSSSILWANSCCADGSFFLKWMPMFCAPMLINVECVEPYRN